MKIKIVLTGDDKVYARKHNLTDSEMRGFIEDMEMADGFEREAICEAERTKAEMLATPQCSVYDAW
tara:strand:- start:2227 stop:2424 length:198 start_codon:yes stop_codon:yes gene_type:complete